MIKLDNLESIENVSETKDITGDNLRVATEDVNIRKMPNPNSPTLRLSIKRHFNQCGRYGAGLV
ncbi:MAG: hypothetical protein CM1200mP13_11260 [Candidatus Pelagibacterales bacterium]|nr:MAG: hypothetical protein CM1200mP13_11260 [Pelagibacterales bacterium]